MLPSAKYLAYRAAFEVLAASHAMPLVRRLSSCRGVIFTLHRVLPEAPPAFSPNAILQVTPDFLEQAIVRVREFGLEPVSLDEALRRIESDKQERPFAVFTFDDAYRDNLVHALPVLRRQRCPFALYVPTAFVDGVGEVWWQALEDIVARESEVAVTYLGETDRFPAATLAEKAAAYEIIYWRMRAMPEADRVELIRAMASQYGLDLEAHCRALVMDWKELRAFSQEKLCTIGAHTVNHYELAKLDPAEARNEIAQSLLVLKAQLGRTPEHLSYPIGGAASAGRREFELARELGLRSAVTTRPGGLYAHHRNRLHELPRISLNGLFQKRRYIDVFATGALFSLAPRREESA